MKTLITAELTEDARARIAARSEIVYEPWTHTGTLLDAEALAERVEADEFDVLVVEIDLVHEEVFEARPLRAVGCCRGDPLNVDQDAATEAGVPVLYTPGRNAPAVAELTVGFILALARDLCRLDRRLRAGGFEPEDMRSLIAGVSSARGFELSSATVGLLGFGAVGRETARRLVPFGGRVIAFDPHVSDSIFVDHGVERVSLEALFAECDVLSLHAPVLRETRGLVNEARIATMKDGARLVNTARHGLLDEAAVLAALRDGKLAGAALDVFKIEPPVADDPFLALDNVIATPHVGGATHEVIVRQSEMITSDLLRVLDGQRPERCANPEVLG